MFVWLFRYNYRLQVSSSLDRAHQVVLIIRTHLMSSWINNVQIDGIYFSIQSLSVKNEWKYFVLSKSKATVGVKNNSSCTVCKKLLRGRWKRNGRLLIGHLKFNFDQQVEEALYERTFSSNRTCTDVAFLIFHAIFLTLTVKLMTWSSALWLIRAFAAGFSDLLRLQWRHRSDLVGIWRLWLCLWETERPGPTWRSSPKALCRQCERSFPNFF